MSKMMNKNGDFKSTMRGIETMTSVSEPHSEKKTFDCIQRKPFDIADAHMTVEHTITPISRFSKSLWSNMFVKDPIKPGIIYPSKPTNERYYDFTHSNIGHALIFNQMGIEGETRRDGSEKDARDLDNELRKLGFDVKVFHDFSVKEIRQKLFSSERLKLFCF